MPRYVIDPEVALALAERRATLPPGVQLLAPTLLRSQVLAQLQADALVTGNAMLAPAAARFVVVEPPGRLLG